MMKGFRRSGGRQIFASVFVKCLGMMALTTILVAAAMAFFAFGSVDRLARQGVVDQAERLASGTAGGLAAPLRFGVVDKVEQGLTDMLATAGDAGLAALAADAQGAVVAAVGDTSLQEGMTGLAAKAVATDARAASDDGLVVAEPIRPDAGSAAVGALVLAMDDGAALHAVAGDKQAIALAALALFGAMSVVSWLVLARTLGRPLDALRAAIARVGEGDYATEVGMKGRRDEIGQIADTLRDVVGTLEEGRQAQNRRAEEHAAQVKVVTRLAEGMDALARGVLTTRIAEEFPETYEALRSNFNEALESLETAVAAVRGNALGIASGADEIAQASEDLARRTETQAATLEESAAAIDELLASVRSAAKNADDAEASVDRTRATAGRNEDVMRAAVSAMSDIEKTSDQIADIISVIDDIAFQTNLLALNAGVEAARAGDSGKGFAVVASEVRALAQRSSAAAQQIKELITGSSDQVKRGARLVEQAGSTLDEVVGQVGEISALVSGIARGASEQVSGLGEINTGVGALDRVTQQNAAMVEETTAAAMLLRSQSKDLIELVDRFRVKGQADDTQATVPSKERAA